MLVSISGSIVASLQITWREEAGVACSGGLQQRLAAAALL